ncbi:acyl carrier protein [Amycolatopsis sp. cg5]|uniref:acyl carrier protein n=1 Tax=Amycolatopsis sp. cg5 TaxID=3238802 RepID=UPI00352559B7
MPELTITDLKSVVEQCVGTDGVSTIGESTLDTAWDELGLDSLAVFEVVTRLQDTLGVRIPDEDVDTFKTPRLLLDSVNSTLRNA